MKKLLSAILLMFSASCLAVELIETPQGILVRSIPSFENGDVGLEGQVGETVLPVVEKEDSKEVTFTYDDVCNGAFYSIKKGELRTYQPLGHLCRKDKKDLTFTFISDTQQNLDELKKGLTLFKTIQIVYPDIRFMVHGGDYAQLSVESEWKSYREIASSYFSSFIPIIPANSNHDYIFDSNAYYYKKVYGLESKPKYYYYVDFGIARIINLNSNINQLSDEDNRKQTLWIEDRLKESSGKAVIIVFHHAMHTSGIGKNFPSGSMSGVYKYIQANWLNVFDKYHVKLVLNGHEHLYERSMYNGTVYLNASALGGSLSEPKTDNPYQQKIVPDVRTVSLIKVMEDGKINIKTFGFGKNTRDVFDLLIDEYTY